MGLFDRLAGPKEIVLTAQAGLLLAAITMVAADGDVEDDELAVIRRLDGSGSTAAWESALHAYKVKPVTDCIPLAAAALSKEQRMVTMANLVDIAMADGSLAGAEKELLEAYVEVFEVSELEVAKMVDVIATKNNRSVFT